MKFKVGDIIYRSYHGIDLCEVCRVGCDSYTIRQINHHHTGTKDREYELGMSAVDGEYELLSDELKAEIL